MNPTQPHLASLTDAIERHPQLLPYKYEALHQQMHIIAIDIPHLSPQSEECIDIQHLSNTTIIITRNHLAPHRSHIQCIRRTSSFDRELAPLAANSVQSSLASLQSSNGLENVYHALRKGKVEVVKTGWPHGLTIQVSYVEHCRKWVISDGKRSRLVEDGDVVEGKEKMDEIVQCWLKTVTALKTKEPVKKKLSNLTISGKISKKSRQIMFYSVVENSSGIELEPFVARAHLEELGLKFVPIKSIGMFNQKDNLVSSLVKTIKSIRPQFCESKSGASGRAKLYFIKGDESFYGGNISTSEDILLREMKAILIKKGESKEKLDNFEQKIDELRGMLPFPLVSYRNLFENMIELVQALQLNQEQIQSNWYKLPKLCLYLITKRLSLNKYAKLYYQAETIDQITDITLEEFGPISSKITIIYYFIHPSSEWKRKVAIKLKESFEAIDLPFSIIPQANSDAQSIKKIITNSQSTLHHLFLHSITSINELKSLQNSLNCASKDHFYKVFYITESFKGETQINGNTYPFSKTTILRSYSQTLETVKHLAKLQDKVKELSKVTTKVKEFKNYEVMDLKNRISISLYDEPLSEDLKRLIQSVLSKYDYNSYLLLISKLQKQGELPSSQELLTAQVTNIIKKSYTPIRTICIKSQ